MPENMKVRGEQVNMSIRRSRSIIILVLVIVLCILVAISAKSDNNVEVEVEAKSTSIKEEFPIEIIYTWEYYKKEAEKNLKEEDVIALAKVTYGEARGIPSLKEKAAVMWCVLNRVDINKCSIYKMATNASVFYGYNKNNPVTDELKLLARDVLIRYYMEKAGRENVGRVLPSTYLFFCGDGKHNYFREQYNSKIYWNWSLINPYSS